jgi:NADPH:quinone reductase-like Zn-dependent oxidoreductase
MAEGNPTKIPEAFSPELDAIVKLQQFTKTYHRDVYPAIDARNPTNSAAGKSVLITGGGSGIGKASLTAFKDCKKLT